MVGEATAEKQAATAGPGPLTEAEARTLDSYWRAANYLAVGQIYLNDNPLHKQTLTKDHIHGFFSC